MHPSAVWQRFLYIWQTQTSYSESHWGEAVCLLPLTEVLLSGRQSEDTLEGVQWGEELWMSAV